MNQVFDYINMDDGFENDRDGPCFGQSALQKNKSVEPLPVPVENVARDRSPTTDREKYKAPEMKKHAQLKKGMFEAVADAEKAEDDPEGKDDSFDAGPR